MALPTIKQLQYLVALHEHQHFSHAADACHVTQSTLSAGLRELEAILGARLVERTRRCVVFTPIGAATVASAREVLDKAQALAALTRGPLAPFGGRLRVSAIPTIAPYLLPPLLAAVKAGFGAVELSLQEELSDEACLALQRDQRDCVILALPYPCGVLETAPLLDDPLLVLYPPGEAPPCPTVKPADLPEARLMLPDDGHCLRQHALAACERPVVEARTIRGVSLATLARLVDAGLGITLMPQLALEHGIADRTRVEARRLDGPQASRQIVLGWRPQSRWDAEFRLLAEGLRAALSV